ncbi:MAG: peptidase [Nitrosopumilaceae archaeon]|nr:peptidase [Nitrosopumilaceae archaeon]
MLPYAILAVAGALFAAVAAAAPGATDLPFSPAYAAQNSNDNLLVSAESPEFDNHFAGSMVVEVVVADPLISDTKGGAAGEPKVSVNGATLRMVQSGSGQWYAYFANEDAARRADQISRDAGRPGQGLDFGVFCGPGTPALVLGAEFPDSDGVAVPRSGGLSNFANGVEPLSTCGGLVDPASPVENNVVRSPPSPSGGEPLHGQIGIKDGAWPVIQLFSFGGDVRIEYERGGGGPQRVVLQYTDDISSISFSTDRGQAEPYPAGAEVILRVSDPQLNQDPTDEDSWTFGTSPGSPSVFYQAFYDGGRTAANGGPGLADLYPHLGRLGFGDNGYLEISRGGGNVLELRPNRNQPVDSVYDGVRHYEGIVTLVESRPNSRLFESVDASHVSNMRIAPGADRGTSAVISYNDRSLSVLTGSHTASLSLGGTASGAATGSDSPVLSVDASGWRSGLRIPVVLQDADQNTDPNRRDRLDVFRDGAIVPSIRIGSPLTLSPASSAAAYPDSGSFEGAVPIPVRSPDPVSARLHLDLGLAALDRGVTYEMIAIDTGYSASRLYDTLIDVSGESNIGTNWFNIDVRSLGGVGGLGGASLLLYVGGTSDADPIIIADRLGAAQGLLYVDPGHVERIASGLQGGGGGTVHAVIDFGPGGGGLDAGGVGTADAAPVVFDVFSLGVEGKKIVNNAIYRLELEEISGDSGVFGGTLEFAAANQLNIDDPDFVLGTTPIGNDVKFVTLGRMVDENAITITYSDLARVGAVIPQSVSQPETEIKSESGRVSVSTPSGQLRFGTPVTITLNDPDLNLSADTIEVYRVVDDSRLPSVDTVGSGAHTLLEVKFKDVRYKRCTVDGVQHGGLASTGFTLVETGPGTGVFEGVFKMPTRVCDKSGSDLMSPAGGAMDVVYYDSVDSSGNPSTFSMLRQQQQQSDPSSGARTQSPLTMGNTGSISGSAGPVPDDDTGDIGFGGAGTADAEIKQPRKPSASLSANRVALERVGDVSSITLSGNVGTYMINSIAAVTVKHPDGTERSFDIRVGANGKYGAIINLKGGNDPQGNYSVSVEYGQNADPIALLTFYVESTPLVIPDSVRAAASEWSVGMIPDAEFARELSVLVLMDILAYDSAAFGAGDDGNGNGDGDGDGNGDDVKQAPDAGGNETKGHGATVPPLARSSMLPAWLDAPIGWWAMGHVPDETLVESIQYLLDAGIARF